MNPKISSLNQEPILDQTQSEKESTKNDRWVTVNGKRFHYVWLRDNCLSPESRHPTSFQKINDISTIGTTPEPLSIEQTDDELIIIWNEEPIHKSVFPLSWLEAHSYDNNPIKSEPKTLWDQAWIQENLLEFPDAKQVRSSRMV